MSENQPKPVAINLMEIWVTGRQMERVRALWRACNRDNTPATEWRPMNPGVAKKAIRSGVFTVTFEGQQSIFCAREFPRERLQISDYARLQLLNTMARNGESLPPLVMPAPTEVPGSDLPTMEAVQPFDSVSVPDELRGEKGAVVVSDEAVKTEAPPAEVLDAAADSVIDSVMGDSPTPLSDGVDSLATDGGVSIPSVGDVAGATTEATHDEQQSDGGRESDRGSEVQGND
jgi:hypothetical protein